MASHENAEVYVDWGSTGFRACRFTPEGPQWHRNPEGGLLHVEQGNFESALRREIGAWLVPGATVWLAGMVTSRNGWVETPYVQVPARLVDLARATVELRIDDCVTLRFVPGISQREPSPDVMRGEEAQVFGTVQAQGSGLVVLPGTHSKWVQVERGAVVSLHTFLTGEMFALLREHSIVGRLIATTPQQPSDAAFARGVADARRERAGGLLHDVFTARSAALLGELDLAHVAEYLSGLLIGHELVAGLKLLGPRAALEPPCLIGEAALLARYAKAFDIAGAAIRMGPGDASVLGLQRLARQHQALAA